MARADCGGRTAGSIRSLHRLGCTLGQPGHQPSAIARNRPDFSVRDRVDRGRMGPRPCVYGTSLELDRIRVVRRLSGCSRYAADRRLGRHLRVELRDGACRLTAGRARGVASTLDLRI